MHEGSFRPDIEGLRALALLGVLLFHSGLPLSGGFVGVDVFFVLSGYLITSLLLRELRSSGSISIVEFYARRGRRLLPAATLVLVATLLLSALLAQETMLSEFSVDAAAAAAYVANWQFAARSVDYLAEDLGRSPFLHFWSLAVEEQFYLLWPALMLFGARTARALRIHPERLLAFLAFIIVGSFLAVALAPDPSTEDFFVTTNRAWELGVGAFLALVPLRFSNLRLRLAAGLLGLAAIGLSYFTASAHDWPSTLTLVPTLGTALVIASGDLPLNGNPSAVHRLLGSAPLIWLGRLSYSVYLWHWPILVLAQDSLGLKGPGWGTLLVLFSFVPAWLSYRWIENPIRHSPLLTKSALATLSVSLNLSLGTIALALTMATFSTPETGGAATSVYLGVRGGKVVVEPAKIGALSLGSDPRRSDAGKTQKRYSRLTPDPEVATLDVPRAYTEGCQVPTGSLKPVWCVIGAPNGQRIGIVAGDSKILQYYEALDAVGQALGFSLRVATKSACAFAPVYGGGSKNHDNDECLLYTNAVLEEIREIRPDFVLTSQYDSDGKAEEGTDKQTAEDMVQGLRQLWSELGEQNTRVFVVLDNPTPRQSVYQCLLDNPDNAKVCSFDRRAAIARSAAPIQRRAAEGMPNVSIIDPTDFICPRARCAPAIGGVLVYRQSSHITNSYARTLAPFFERELREKLGDALK